MPPKNIPSIYPYLAASFIEADSKGSTIEAIRFITQEELKGLKNTHKRSELERVVAASKAHESRIFSLISDLDPSGGSFIYTLSKEIKGKMEPLFASLLFLYEHRMGKEHGAKLRKLLLSEGDEAFDFILEYSFDREKKVYSIKRLSLVAHTSPEENDTNSENGASEGKIYLV